MDKRKLAWLSWDKNFNQQEAIWQDLLVFNYSDVKSQVNEDFPSKINKKDSILWRNLKTLESDLVVITDALKDCFRGRVGNYKSLGFWKSRWIGGEVLCKEFHDLYSMSVRKDVKVVDMDNWNGPSLSDLQQQAFNFKLESGGTKQTPFVRLEVISEYSSF
ncbi:hypothetical protein KIW84_070868 [Lathyrus oleraceus]|uniref:Uncharacterized protein n=1 Tax=Pisum sativum TaxID=3888 RepID=A0A9D4VHI6_PEA|nr:hypothetical protein KIW84_070868 [Pisum sativum]